MLSLEKGFTGESIEAFQKRVEKLLGKTDIEYSVEVKMDGLAISVFYENGHFKRAITRGDGKVGSDVTQNVKTIRSLPLRLFSSSELIPDHIELRGEVFLPKSAFERLNKEREKEGLPLWANPRNAAAGSLKLLDSKEVAKRKELDILFYSVGNPEELPITSQSQLKSYLKAFSLPVVAESMECKSLEEIMQFKEKMAQKRSSLDYAIDGLVIKVASFHDFEELGFTGKHPRGALAFKFSAEQTETQVRAISVQIGRTGALTPVAELEPVLLDGSTIARATLHNFEELARKDVREGDFVTIEKGGDVIPKVVSVNVKKRKDCAQVFLEPESCPSCGKDVQKDPSEAVLRCTNRLCPAQRLAHFIHFASKQGLDIENLGDKVVEQLYEKGFIQSVSDIFSLTEEQLYQLDGFKKKSVDNLLRSIEKAKKVSLAQLLQALGIRFVGAQSALLLEEHFHNLEKLQHATKEEILQIDGIGEKVAHSILSFFQDDENKKELEELFQRGLRFKEKAALDIEHPFYGKTFVLTGSLETFSRSEGEKAIKACGGKVKSSVGKKVDYVVVGKNAGSKAKKAQELGIPMLDEKEFLELYGKEIVS